MSAPRTFVLVANSIQIHIRYYAETNTTLKLSNYFTLNITNAPTSIDAVYTGTSATFITQSNPMPQMPMAHVTYGSRDNAVLCTNYRSHSSPSFTYVDGYSFMLSMTFVDPQNNNRLIKRQGSAYLGGSGKSKKSCANAVLYSLVNGKLFANTTSGASLTCVHSSHRALILEMSPPLSASILRTISCGATMLFTTIWHDFVFFRTIQLWLSSMIHSLPLRTVIS